MLNFYKKMAAGIFACFITLWSHAQIWTSETATAEMRRCAKIIALSDSDFVSLRHRHLLKEKLDSVKVFLNTYTLSDSELKAQMLIGELAVQKTILDSFPTYSYAWLLRGNMLYNLSRDNGDEAITCYQKAIQYSTKPSRDAIYNIGCIMMDEGKNEEAMVRFLAAYYVDTTDVRCTYNLGATFHNLGVPELAIKWYMRTLELMPYDAETWYRIGTEYGKVENKLDSAIIYIGRAIALDSGVAVYYDDLGVAYSFSLKYDDAIAVSKKCLEKFPRHLPALYNIAISYDKKEDTVMAGEYRKKLKLIQDGVK